jgi:hypothetical protein
MLNVFARSTINNVTVPSKHAIFFHGRRHQGVAPNRVRSLLVTAAKNWQDFLEHFR